MKKELSMVWDVEIKKIDKRDVMKATAKLIEIIQNEKIGQNEVIINASGSLRTLAIYIAACITSSRIFTSIPRYNEREEEIGIEEIIEIPTLPVDFPGEEQMEIISSLKDGVDSLDEFVLRLNPDISREEERFKKERSRLNHHISKLERAGMVRKEKEGRNVRIGLTALGKFLIEGVRSYRTKKNEQKASL